MPVPSGRALSLSNNPFGEVWRTRRSATSIVATAAGRVRRSFRLTPSGRFATFGGKCPGCSIIRASLTVALMVSLPRFGSLWAFGPSAHRAHASLRATGLTLPSVPSKVNSYRPAFPGRSIFAEGADRAHRSFRSLANIGVLRAGRAQPLYLLTPAGRFGPSAQQPTGLALPSGAGRAGSLRPWAQTFLKHLAKKAAASGLFRQAACPSRQDGRFFLHSRLTEKVHICTIDLSTLKEAIR